MSFAFAFGGGTAGGAPAARSVNVPAGATGRVVQLARLLGSTSTFSLRSGGSTNVSLDNGDGLALGTGLASGASVKALLREQKGTGDDIVAVDYAVTLIGSVAKPSLPVVTVSAGNGQITVAWVDGSNGGAAINSHNIYVNGVLVASPTAASPYVISGLTNGTAYSVRVSAVNTAGEGELSSAQSATPTAATFTTLAATAPTTGISLLSRNGRDATMGGRYALGPTLTNVMGNGTAGGAGALALWVRFKPGEIVNNAYDTTSSGICPIFGTSTMTGSGTQAVQYCGPNNANTLNGFSGIGGRFSAAIKDGTAGTAGNIATLFSPLILRPELVDQFGVFSGLLVIRRDDAGNWSFDIFDALGNKYAGSVQGTPSTWVGRSIAPSQLKFGCFSTNLTPPAVGYQTYGPIAFSDFIQLDVAGTDAEWATFAKGGSPAALWGSGLAAHYPLRSPNDLSKAAGSRSYGDVTLGVTAQGIFPHGQVNMGKLARSADGSKGIGWAPIFHGYVHGLLPSQVAGLSGPSDLENLKGSVVRRVIVDGAATHLQARAAQKTDGVIVRDWTRVTSAPVTGRAKITLPGVPVAAEELILELRREDDTSFVAQGADYDAVGVVMMPTGQSQVDFWISGSANDDWSVVPNTNSRVSFMFNRRKTSIPFIPVDGGFVRTTKQVSSGAVMAANWWDSLGIKCRMMIAPLAIPGSATFEWMLNRTTTTANGNPACAPYFGDGQDPTSGNATAVVLACDGRITVMPNSWATADRSTTVDGSYTITQAFNTINGPQSPTELGWKARANELYGGIPKSTADATEQALRTNFVKAGFLAEPLFLAVLADARESKGNVTDPHSSNLTAVLFQNARKTRVDWANGIGRTGVNAVFAGYLNDGIMDSSSSPHNHMSSPMGNQLFGLSLIRAGAYAIKAWVADLRPRFETATGVGTDTLTLPAILPNGGSLMVGTPGAVINGFAVSVDSGANWSYFDGSVPFTATIVGNSVQLKRASGVWPSTTLVDHLYGFPYSRNASTIDEPTNTAGFLYESKASAIPPGVTGIPAGIPIIPTDGPITPT